MVIVLTSGTAVVIFFTSGMLRYGVDRWTAVVILMTAAVTVVSYWLMWSFC